MRISDWSSDVCSSDLPKRVVFAEGEEERTIRAALAFQQAGYGAPVLVGREQRVLETMKSMGLERGTLEIPNARLSKTNARFVDFLYQRIGRRRLLNTDCPRMVNPKPPVSAAPLLA